MMSLMRYGEPTRDHWETDHTRTTCASEDCGAPLRMGARHHCRKCGKLFCDACAGGGYSRRLDAKADYAVRGVFSPVCRACFLCGNGWFAARGSEEWAEASTGHATDRMGDFDRERKVAQAARRAAAKEESVKVLTPAWRCRTLQQISGALVEEYAAAGGMESVGRATRGLAGGAHNAKSKTHWVSARNVLLCQQASCRRAFTLNERKHHCRVCGQVFCDTCSPKRLDALEYAAHFASEEQLPVLEVLRGTDEEAVRLERACDECFREVRAELQRMAHRRRLEGAGGHVICNLYAPIPSYVRGMGALLDKMCSSIAYLDRMRELCEGDSEGEELRQMAAADVLEVKGELLDLFKRYEQRYSKILTWGGWQYYQMLAEGTPVTGRDGVPMPNIFMWQGRVCRHVAEREGWCVIVADALDPTRPGEVLFEGAVQANVEEQLRVLRSLRMYFSAIWTERYHVQFKALVDGANRAIHAASQPRASPAVLEPKALSPAPQQAHRPPASGAPERRASADASALAAEAAAVGHVLVHVIEAAELDLCGIPAKKLSVHVLVACGVHRQVSHICKRTADPRWDQKFALLVQDLQADLIALTVMNKGDELGSWTFGVCELVEEMGGNMQGWVVLCPPATTQQDVDQGRIRISVKFMPSEATEKGQHEAERQIVVPEVSLLVDEDGRAAEGAVAVVVAQEGAREATEEGDEAKAEAQEPSKADAGEQGAGERAELGGSGSGVGGSGAGEQERTPDARGPVDVDVQIEALTRVYVRVYTIFNEVKKWKGQLDVAQVVPAGVQLEMVAALTQCLEKVGANLQDTVSQGGMEWKTQRQEVLKAIKAKTDSGEYMLFTQQERVKLLSSVGVNKALKGVELLSKADSAFSEAQVVLDKGGCGAGAKPRAYEALGEAKVAIDKLAKRLASS